MALTATGNNSDTSVVLLTFPFPEHFIYRLCYLPSQYARPPGRFQTHIHLAKHLKLHHLLLNTKWICDDCMGSGAY